MSGLRHAARRDTPLAAPLFALLAAAPLAGCSGSDEPATPSERTVPAARLALDETDLSAPGVPAAPSEERFRALVTAALGEPPSLPGEVAPGELDVVAVLEPAPAAEVADGRAPDGGARASAFAIVLEARIGVCGFAEPITAGVMAVGPAGDAAKAERLIANGLADLARAVRAHVELLGADRERVVRALHSAEADEQLLAIRLLRRARDARAVDAIASLLGDPRPHVAEAAAEAVGELGDASAVPLLVGSIRRGDLRSEVRALEAIARIGGPEAEAYVEMVAGGHEIGERRRMAADLLERMRARR